MDAIGVWKLITDYPEPSLTLPSNNDHKPHNARELVMVRDLKAASQGISAPNSAGQGAELKGADPLRRNHPWNAALVTLLSNVYTFDWILLK